jgi:hypothetical protein
MEPIALQELHDDSVGSNGCCAELMGIQTRAKLVVAMVVLWIAAVGACGAANLAAGWDPVAFRDQRTLQIMTTGAEEGAHWSKLWLVVIDGQLFVRLDGRTFERVKENLAGQYVMLKIGDQKFERVRLEAAPDMSGRVAAAMADKYPMDVLIRHESHPMTARLIAEPSQLQFSGEPPARN